jgi:hypothetical protein
VGSISVYPIHLGRGPKIMNPPPNPSPPHPWLHSAAAAPCPAAAGRRRILLLLLPHPSSATATAPSGTTARLPLSLQQPPPPRRHSWSLPLQPPSPRHHRRHRPLRPFSFFPAPRRLNRAEATLRDASPAKVTPYSLKSGRHQRPPSLLAPTPQGCLKIYD